MYSTEGELAVQPLEAARQAARTMFAGLMPGGLGIEMADEIGEKIYAAVEFEKCTSNVPTANGDDSARYCCMVVGHTGEFHQSADGWMWTNRHALARLPGFEASDWRNHVLTEASDYLSDHHRLIAEELIKAVRFTDLDHAHHGVIAASKAVRDMIVSLNNEPHVVHATQVVLADLRQAALEGQSENLKPRWRRIITDSEGLTGVALVCTAEGVDDQHAVFDDFGGRDEAGVYDCCPGVQFEVYNEALASYLVAVLNNDAGHAAG